ncbi:MAG: DUF1330 domain-containing protein [Pseudomonadales bacterium]|nr:DUF1330 domain-containing protein [Pseudomonadales bacterium]NRA14011.1 DUF1330 domain-containing protein [Oceanospirillaceae bacterium]
MRCELLVGLNVTDAEQYRKYREAMTPLLKKHHGGFRYDFWVNETLKSETSNVINRDFVIYFKDKNCKELFFNNTDYLLIKKNYYQGAVAATTILSEYNN